MKGRTQYKLPDRKTLQMSYNSMMRDEQHKLLEGLSGGEQGFGGIIKLSDEHAKNKQLKEKRENEDPLNSYVNHFSEIAEMLEDQNAEGQKKVQGLAKGLKQQVMSNKVKLDLRNAIMKTLVANKEERELSKHTEDSPEVMAAKREK